MKLDGYKIITEDLEPTPNTINLPQAGEIIAKKIEKSPSKRPGMTIAKITTFILRKKRHPELTSEPNKNIL